MRFSVTPTSQNALFRYVTAREARGATPPPACGALWKVAQLGKCARATPRQAAGGLCQNPQASAWGLTARKGALWAEGFAEGAPWVRPGHHQAASCGLRRCRELGLREFVWVVASLPWRRGGRHRQAVRRKSVHRSAKTASRIRFEALVYTVAPRAASGGTSTSTTMACRWRPLAGRFSLGREDRLCASGAAVRLASSPRQQPTQIPDGPGSSGLYEGREGRPPREGPVTLDLLTRWPRHPAPIQSGA